MQKSLYFLPFIYLFSHCLSVSLALLLIVNCKVERLHHPIVLRKLSVCKTYGKVCVCGWVTDRRLSPQGALQGAIDKDSLGKFFSLVLRLSSVTRWCQVTICHATAKKKGVVSSCFGSFIWLCHFSGKIISLACIQTKA